MIRVSNKIILQLINFWAVNHKSICDQLLRMKLPLKKNSNTYLKKITFQDEHHVQSTLKIQKTTLKKTPSI